MTNWRDPVEDRDYELPPRPKDKIPKENTESEQNKSKVKNNKPSLIIILSGLSVFMLCAVFSINIYIALQVKNIANFTEIFSLPTATFLPTQTVIPPTAIVIPTLKPTESIVPSLEPTIVVSPTITPNMVAQENFPDTTQRSISLKAGELIIGTAVKFSAPAYNCNTMNLTEKIPYTIFLISGPIKTNIEIYNGGWDYWTNVYSDNFVKSLLDPKRDEVKRHPDYLIVGHVECIIIGSK